MRKQPLLSCSSMELHSHPARHPCSDRTVEQARLSPPDRDVHTAAPYVIATRNRHIPYSATLRVSIRSPIWYSTTDTVSQYHVAPTFRWGPQPCDQLLRRGLPLDLQVDAATQSGLVLGVEVGHGILRLLRRLLVNCLRCFALLLLLDACDLSKPSSTRAMLTRVQCFMTAF